MSYRSASFVLFDLDGTLIRPGGTLQRAHMTAMTGAIAAVTGHADAVTYHNGCPYYRNLSLTGFTDAGTIRAVLVHTGVPAKEHRDLVPAIVDDMVRRLDPPPAGGCRHLETDLLAGSRELLEQLRDDGFVLGMSTGNARAVARWKMRHTHLADLLDSGGFGDRITEREHIVAAAVAAVGPADRRCGVLVGDTPRDIAAAHHAGLPCIAVASGAASAADLAAAGADSVVPTLAGPDVLAAVHAHLDQQFATAGYPER